MLRLGRLHLHWSLLLGGLLFCAVQPSALLLLGYALILVVHVAGHALASAGSRPNLTGVMVHGLGGELLGDGEVTPVRRSVIALCGVLAQLALLGAALAFRDHLPPELSDAFVRRNGLMLLLNLVPMRPLDGVQAWRLFRRLRARSRAHRLRGVIEIRELPISRQVHREVGELLDRIRSSPRVR